MSHIVFSNISNRSDGDRFIPRRHETNTQIANFKLKSNESRLKNRKQGIFSQKPEVNCSYIKLLQSAVKYSESPILSFSKRGNSKASHAFVKSSSQWPAFPRSRSVLTHSKPDIILDLPNVTTDLCSNILDWSPSGHMTTISSNRIYMWRDTPDQMEEIISTRILADRALRWNHAGTYLAVGRKYSAAVWDMSTRKMLMECECSCMRSYCYFSVLTWDRTDKFLISGCSNGMINVWNIYTYGAAKPVKRIVAHLDAVISLAFCKSNRYLCSSSADDSVRIWMWPSLETCIEINYPSPVRAVTFHPWREGLLAIGGGVDDGSLAIWNVNNMSQVGFMEPEKDSFVDCLTWNAVTGELISSHQIINQNEPPTTKILVLASLDQVVDTIEVHDARVLYLMWDKSGKKLATAGSEENLCIWNYLGNSSQSYSYYKNYNHCKSRKKSESVLSNFEKCIR